VGESYINSFGCQKFEHYEDSDDEKNPRWKVWQLRDGMTSCYREHFDNQHHQLWKQICRNMSLKSRHRAHHSVSGDQRVFSAEMFHHLLMRWVAVDDQVCLQADSNLDTDLTSHFVYRASMSWNVQSFGSFSYTLVMGKSMMPSSLTAQK
jgi:hypothetical protein